MLQLRVGAVCANMPRRNLLARSIVLCLFDGYAIKLYKHTTHVEAPGSPYYTRVRFSASPRKDAQVMRALSATCERSEFYVAALC